MKRILCITFGIAILLSLGGCSFIAGPIAPDHSTIAPPFRLDFKETLQSQNSLRSESFREFTGNTPTGLVLRRPTSVYADQFRVYVTDSSFPNGIFVFERGDGTLSLLSPALEQGRFLGPTGITVDAAGVIYVADGPQGRVHGFDRAGRHLFVIGRAQTVLSRQGLGDLAFPAGLAVDKVRSRLYVADTQAQQVKVFGSMGMHLFDLGNTVNNEQDFKFPVAVALDGAGRVFVLDSLRQRVFVFDPEGTFLSSFSLKGAVPGQSIKPRGIAVDSDGHIYVIDSVNNNVLIFNPDGSLVLTWGRTGRLNGDFWTPVSIFIDNHDTIYIADQTNSRIQTFQYAK